MGTATLDDRADKDAAPSRSRRRRGRGKKIAGLVVAVACAGAVAAAMNGLGDTGTNEMTSTLPPATAVVKRETLVDTRDADGELGYGPATTSVSRQPGTVTWLPDSGAQITRGEPLYKIDNRPVVLMYGATPAYRDLRTGIEGPDVKRLERNLSELGYTDFTVDDAYTSATAAAVMRWQEDRGLEETGVVELGRVVFAGGRVRVDSLEAETGQPTAPGQKVLTHTGTTKVVTVRLQAEDRQMAKKGARVSVTLPDGDSVAGKVTEVATVIEPGEGPNADPETSLEAVVSLSRQKAVNGLDQAAVDVTFTASRREDVLTVPVSALVALREGGFGVEVVEGAKSRYLQVKTGLFAGGRVEISGDGLAEGATVGMPK
ncbi:peptidoglycan-binding protein [Microtetraspora sp. NBRC 13810]|uniref:peptidoglycan-binding protein n=1 Tax=Microtetraspora sp. NBRC 13810 TaxID=3030990 RepID=UPI0024A07C0C|nr:peptidoglycan-binding protein [Microtetraspora sp. NBRC 13810]GLW11527.1 peptidoglycan-binding protein [Microtetraspora sp. NBRC 13810]